MGRGEKKQKLKIEVDTKEKERKKRCPCFSKREATGEKSCESPRISRILSPKLLKRFLINLLNYVSLFLSSFLEGANYYLFHSSNFLGGAGTMYSLYLGSNATELKRYEVFSKEQEKSHYPENFFNCGLKISRRRAGCYFPNSDGGGGGGGHTYHTSHSSRPC